MKLLDMVMVVGFFVSLLLFFWVSLQGWNSDIIGHGDGY